jgi:hypothetical protein
MSQPTKISHHQVENLPPGAFKTHTGNMFTVGQRVQHSSGLTGTVTGLHPHTKKAIIKWDNGD